MFHTLALVNPTLSSPHNVVGTKPGVNEELKTRQLVSKVPAGEELKFDTFAELAQWSAHMHSGRSAGDHKGASSRVNSGIRL